MYAFAIWDSRRDQLVMIRDRMGIKPFYYHPTSDGVLFGSEPKAILANPLARPKVTLDGLRELFTMIKTPGHAIWDGMHEVEPGTVVTVDRSGLRRRVYWQLETRPHTDDRDATVAHVRTLLDDIVRRQLVADVPRCTLLSGGLDSSAMTAIAARQLAEHGEKVRSFAVDFVGQNENFVADELRGTPRHPYVHDVARASGTDHQDIVLDAQALADLDVRAKMLRARDLPWASATWTPRCTCSSAPSATSRRSPCPASPPTRSSAATSSSSTRRPGAPTPSPGWSASASTSATTPTSCAPT